MKTYKIAHKETLFGYFYVEANSPEEAMEEYNRMVENSEIDFSGLEMSDSEDYVESDSFTAFVYEDDGIIAADMATYDNKYDAISFAKSRGWDEVVDDITGEIVYRK